VGIKVMAGAFKLAEVKGTDYTTGSKEAQITEIKDNV
jgi:hypothetical protein